MVEDIEYIYNILYMCFFLQNGHGELYHRGVSCFYTNSKNLSLSLSVYNIYGVDG